MKAIQVPFDIFIPATETRAAVKVDTIQITVHVDAAGNEAVAHESTVLIEKTQARYMGLLAGEDIRTLRERLGLSQDQLSDLLGCGKKSLSRWENGHEVPSQLVNTLLRLLDEDRATVDDLRSVRQPRSTNCEKIVHFIDKRRKAPSTYNLSGAWSKSAAASPELIAM